MLPVISVKFNNPHVVILAVKLLQYLLRAIRTAVVDVNDLVPGIYLVCLMNADSSTIQSSKFIVK